MPITKNVAFVPVSEASPDIRGHYDCWSKTEGRVSDAWFEDGKWFDEYLGREIRGVESWASVPSPFDGSFGRTAITN